MSKKNKDEKNFTLDYKQPYIVDCLYDFPKAMVLMKRGYPMTRKDSAPNVFVSRNRTGNQLCVFLYDPDTYHHPIIGSKLYVPTVEDIASKDWFSLSGTHPKHYFDAEEGTFEYSVGEALCWRNSFSTSDGLDSVIVTKHDNTPTKVAKRIVDALFDPNENESDEIQELYFKTGWHNFESM